MCEFKQETSAYLNKELRLKDYYPKAYGLINHHKFSSVLDVGCASGDFLQLMPYPDVKCIGVDISEELIKNAKSRNQNKNIKFYCKNILSNDFTLDKPIQFVTCFGSVAVIDDLDTLLQKIIVLDPKLIMFNDVVNENGLDVKCGYRRSNQDKFNFIYNIRSFNTWEKAVNKFKGYSINFEPYKMKNKLNPSDDPIRNFHSNLDGEIVQRNGLDLITRPYNIYIEKNV